MGDYRTKLSAPEKCKLTVVMTGCSTKRIVDEEEHTIKKSDYPCGKGMACQQRLRTKYSDSFGRDALLIEVELGDNTTRLRVSSINGERTWPELRFWPDSERVNEEEGGDE
jgi:hypothetical protein